MSFLCIDDSPFCLLFLQCYVQEQPVASEEYCVVYWLRELQESMERCIGYRDITEKLENRVNDHTINHSIAVSCKKVKNVVTIFLLYENMILGW